jgi:V8-like Glu-specific endopeptidase
MATTATRPWVLCFAIAAGMAATCAADAEVASQRALDHFKLAIHANECVDCDNPPADSAGVLHYWSTTRLTQRAGHDGNISRSDLSDKESSQFSGIGSIVCTVDGTTRATTAFLVGAFDVVVTMAHEFDVAGQQVDPSSCVYTTADPYGQVRERIPVSYVRSQWQLEAGAEGQPLKDLAVVRLSQFSDYAERTMPLGKYRGGNSPVVMIGFDNDLDLGSVKRKSSGNILDRRNRDTQSTSLLTHDMNGAGIASGAPVMDERTGVIIGLHATMEHVQASNSAGWQTQRNTFIPMNEWLEHTLKTELSKPDARAKAD